MARTFSLDQARRIVEAAVAESERRGVHTAVAVVDTNGDPMMIARVDGARSYYPDVAYGKALAAALWEEDSRNIPREPGSNSIQQRVNQLMGGRIVYATGAVVLRIDGEFVGAVGVGGSGPESDEEIAKLAAAELIA